MKENVREMEIQCSQCRVEQSIRWVGDKHNEGKYWCYACYRRYMNRRPICEECGARFGTPTETTQTHCRVCVRQKQPPPPTAPEYCTRCQAYGFGALLPSPMHCDDWWCCQCQRLYDYWYFMDADTFARL